ncbi:MAG TPA: hypothetical protein VL979_08150 [Solirubrobacteraceae bacterium]|nr:hypothetical protein [Solirubrobacteraceae bacterium]
MAFNDRRYGRQNGKAEAAGHDMTGADGIPHAESLIDAQAERGIADQRRGFKKPKEAAEQVRQDAIEEQQDAGREIERIAGEDAKLAVVEEGLGRRHGPGPIAYGLILFALFCLTLPIDYGAASWMPLPPLAQWVLAVFIGVVMVLCAHQTAKKVEDLQESHATREEDPFAYRKDQLALGAALTTALTVIVGTTIWRGQVFASEVKEAGGPHSTAANLALGLLALMAFVVAVLAGMGYRRMEPLRTVRHERSKLKGERQGWQAKADLAQRRQAQAEVTLAFLAEREEQVIEAIGHWAVERKARLRQRTSWVSLCERQRHPEPELRSVTPGSSRGLPRPVSTLERPANLDASSNGGH